MVRINGKYNQFVFKCFDFPPFEISCLNAYHLAVMCFSTIYKASFGSEILHVVSSINS